MTLSRPYSPGALRYAIKPLAAALMALMVHAALAFEPFVVSDIRIEGAQRTEPGTVFNYLPVKVGERFTQEQSDEAVRALFATGFFRDVRLEVDGSVLVVYLEERPAIASVDVTGTKEFERDAVIKVLRDTGLGEARIFDRSLLERSEQELKRQYLSRGKYAVRITTTVTPLPRNRVGLVLAVDEGETARITDISIVGNRAFSEKELRNQMSLSTPTWLSWYTKNDQYAREKLAADIETLRSYYLDRGYLEFSIESTQVSITPSKEDVLLTLVVKEGEVFKFAGFTLGGDLLGREAELKALFTLRAGETYSGGKLTDSTKLMTERLGELGYAFANISALPNIDRAKREVSFQLVVDPGPRVYVRKINISGNISTRDIVIRRELRQYENAWYDAEKIRLSRVRVERLGYFTEVKIDPAPVPGASDQVDLSVTVREQRTGSLNLGFGFSTADKLILTASVNQNNFLGTGKAMALSLNTSRVSRTVSISYTDPYYTADGVSRTVELYTRTFDGNELSLGDYQLRSTGFGMRFGIPYTEIDRVSLGLSAENSHVALGPNAPERYIQYVNGVYDPVTGELLEPGYGASSNSLLANLAWARDRRDSPIMPTRGRYQVASLEVTLPVGDLRYYRLGYQDQWYQPLNKDITLGLFGDLGYGGAIGTAQYPTFKNYYAGGIGSVRGYETSSLGPGVDPVANTPLGGQIKMVGSVEVSVPIFGSGNDRSFRSFFFFDAGNVFPKGGVDLGELRYSAGFGITWISPIGPMKFSYGFPIKRAPEDRVQHLQFQVGTGF